MVFSKNYKHISFKHLNEVYFNILNLKHCPDVNCKCRIYTKKKINQISVRCVSANKSAKTLSF